MFESDDFDQVLSQFVFPEDVQSKLETNKPNLEHDACLNGVLDHIKENIIKTNNESKLNNHNKVLNIEKIKIVKNENKNSVSPKQLKRKIINSHFDHKSKRKFPGPAGLLTGGLQENKDETICHMELLSQDVDFTQNNLNGELFESPLWERLLNDLNTWNLKHVDSIKTIKQQAIVGSLRRRKAHTITAFVETVDRSVTDPLIIMRDKTGNIKGTLHRDAWSAFSQYIAAEHCAFILWKPTILTTGAAFKKHYLNITLSNILAIYSTTVLNEDESKPLPDGYTLLCSDDYTVIKSAQSIGTSNVQSSVFNEDSNDLLDGLDSIFSDDIF